MTRRLLLLLPFAACLRADSARDVEQLIADAVSGLSAGKPEEFLEAFDPAMPDFSKLRTALEALIARAELSCALEILGNEGDDSARVLTLDWILRVDPKVGSVGATRRQKTVTCKWKKTGRKWRIVAFDSLDLFAQPA